MPELPEVETVRKGLEAALKGAKIQQVTLRRKDLRTPFPKNFEQALAGRTLKTIRRRAKYLLFELDNSDVLIAHLGMSGRFSVLPKPPKQYEKHDHVVFTLTDGREVVFNDARRFGLMDIAKAKDLSKHPLFAHLGPEPLEKEFSAAYLEKALSSRKAPVKVALMDQELVVGVGNIYASEALFLAGIDPRKKAKNTAKYAPKILTSVRKVLNLALESGGSSLRDFVHVSGKSGYFRHSFQVYDRAGEPCFRCKINILSFRQAGRSTYFCPTCQK